MKDYQERVVNEYNELRARTVALGLFLESKQYTKLDEAEKERLAEQWKIMQSYGHILSERIEAFK